MAVRDVVQAAAGISGGGDYGEAIFTDTASAISWVVPDGVTSISAVCIGGGGGGAASTSGGMGGGGGDLRYYNNLSVTPGETLTITVGTSGTIGASGTYGGFSRIARSGTTLLEAAGGGGGTISGSAAKNGTSTTIAGSVGGGDGGTCANGAIDECGGGGGAGGYAGNGGNGGRGFNIDGTNGAANSGAGGGGGGGADGNEAGAGGGVNVFGLGPTGEGGTGGISYGDSATGGSYGDGGLTNDRTSSQSSSVVPSFGGGGGGADNGGQAGVGGQGVVRIVWSGNTRSFPSTDVWMSQTITTVIETQSSVGTTITIPASAQAGDLAVLMNTAPDTFTPTNPTGWTRIINHNATNPTMTVWYRILQSGDPNTSVTMAAGSAPSVEMLVFRKATGTVSSVTVSGATIQQSGAIPTTQTQSASTATGPFIVMAALAANNVTMSSSDMYFTGGIAGVGNVEPSYVYTGGNGDGSRQSFMRFKIYDEAPASDVNVVCRRDIGQQTMGSFIIEVN